MNFLDPYINDLTNSPTMPAELIHFRNVKTKYCLNEDILLEYVLDAEIADEDVLQIWVAGVHCGLRQLATMVEMQPSFRDWIGLYPRGWTDMHQCVTFEWVTIWPCEASLERNILFHWRHHAQVVHTDREYQFLYVNRQLEILGRSLLFRFTGTDKRNTIHTVSSDNVLTSSISLDADSSGNHNNHVQDQTCQFIIPSRPRASVTMMMDRQQMNSPSVGSDITTSTPDVPSFFHPDIQNHVMTTYFTSKQQSDLLHSKYSCDNKVKSSAELFHNLEDRIHDLENDLEVSLVAQKHLKLVAHQSEQKMLAYQKFVNDLCLAFSQKGVVRVIDGQGTEILVKQVLNPETQTDVTEGHPHQNAAEISHKDPILNSGIGCQAQVIHELLLCLNSTSKACSNFSRKMESVKHVVQSLIAVVSCRQEGVPANDPCEAANHSLSFDFEPPSNEAEPVCLVGSSEQKVGELTDKGAETPQFPDHCAEPVSEKALINVDKSCMTPLLLRSHLH